MGDDAYDRDEALGEARALLDEPEPWDDEYWQSVACVVCSGPLIELGDLGKRTHYRCRYCGLDQSVERS